jgi:ubiquinone/menaquinone biosynthesis C-methylase UbiE
VRQAARKSKRVRFTALLHHITLELLTRSYLALERDSAQVSKSSDKVAAVAGTLAEFHDRYLVPLNFAPYAEVVADRAKVLLPRRVLETAAGTGVVTEVLARIPPTDLTITVTDLNQAMIERGKVRPGMERVNW